MPRRIAAHYAPLGAFVAVIWVVHGLNTVLGQGLSEWFGLYPRRVFGLDGVLGAPFLHADWAHLSANTPPLLILGAMLFTLTPQRYWTATLIIVIASGLCVWLFARPAYHIGASGLIFGWFGFLVALAWWERSRAKIIGAVLALLLYGAPMLSGIVPSGLYSWEFHLFGLMAGVLAAWNLARPRTG